MRKSVIRNIYIGFTLLLFLCMVQPVDAQFNALQRNVNQGWKKARRFAKKHHLGKRIGIHENGAIQNLANDGLNLAEQGFGGLADFSGHLYSQAVRDLTETALANVNSVIDNHVKDKTVFLQNMHDVLDGMYTTEHLNKTESLVRKIKNAAADGDIDDLNQAIDRYRDIYDGYSELRSLVHDAKEFGYDSIIFALDVGGASVGSVEVGTTVGVAISLSEPEADPSAVLFYGFGGSSSFYESAGLDIAANLLLAFHKKKPKKIVGPSLFGIYEESLSTNSFGVIAIVSLPTVTGVFPSYSVAMPTLLQVTVSRGFDGGFDFPLSIGAEYTGILYRAGEIEMGDEVEESNAFECKDEGTWTSSNGLHYNSGGYECEGTDGPDTIYGTNNDDLIRGGEGHDIIEGDGGRDHLSGGRGKDFIYGKRGDDVLHPYYGDEELMMCGPGSDVVVFPMKEKKYKHGSDERSVGCESGRVDEEEYCCERQNMGTRNGRWAVVDTSLVRMYVVERKDNGDRVYLCACEELHFNGLYGKEVRIRTNRILD